MTVAAEAGRVRAGDGDGVPLEVRVETGGRPAADGTEVVLRASLGRVELEPTTGGVARGRYLPGNVSGRATLSLEGDGELAGVTALAVETGRAWAAQLHLHGSISESTGTSLFQVSEAEKYGTDVLWWTDHDWAYAGTFQQDDPGFEEGWLATHRVAFPDPYWEVTDSDESVLKLALADHAGATELALDLVPQGEGRSWGVATWRTAGPGTRHALLGGTTLDCSLRLPDDWNPNVGERWPSLSVRLSRPLPDVGTHRLILADPRDPRALGDGDALVPMTLAPGDNHWVVDLSAAAEAAFGSPDEGLEDVSVALSSQAEAPFEVALARLSVTQAVHGEALRELHESFLADRFPPPAPAQYVGFEAGTELPHLNVFGEAAPVGDPREFDFPDDAPNLVALEHDAGALVSLNHMFGIAMDATVSPEEEGLAAEVCADLLDTAAYGVDLLEVGYPARELPIEDHLDVWDCLAMSGVRLTGLGTSDLHEATPWDVRQNNFVTWVYAADSSRASLLEGLAGGRAFFGDPVIFGTRSPQVDLVSGSLAQMGQVVAPAPESDEVSVQLSPLDVGMVVRLVGNGVTLDEGTVTEDGPYRAVWTLVDPGDLVLRAEVWSAEGKPLLFSNPLYYVRDTIALPEAREPRP